MSQAIIDFCEGLKTTLLGVEDRLAKAKDSLASGAGRVEDEAKKHIDEASEQLRAFKAEAARMAEKVRAELPEGAGAAQEKLKEFGLEAQVALRHAAVFLAENAAKGAETAAAALKKGAENLRRETAVANRTEAPPSS
ncbi:MAG: hypothetical protein JNJ73_13705 [Hyphomonadaceae bacterium]|nr:hypothetical protein [Hyphomonadaceae bacterium]